MKKPLLHRRESLILTAIEVINDLGIQGLSTREIARRQEISEGTLFRHFDTKNHLLIGVLDHYSQYDSDIMLSIKMKELSFKEAIIFFTKSYTEYYENYPAITAVTETFSVLANDPQLVDKVKSIIRNRIDFIKELIIEGQRLGQVPMNIDAEKLTDIIWGTAHSIIAKWRFEKYNFSLKEYSLSTLDMILRAFNIE